jgi:hypothetical protein
MVTPDCEIAESLTIIPLGYALDAPRALQNLGRMILRYADAAGRPVSIAAFCHTHARLKVARGRARRLKFYDDRES